MIANQSKLRWFKLAVLLLALVFLPSCGILGRQVVEREVVFVNTVDDDGNAVQIGRVGKNIKIPMEYVGDDGKRRTKVQDIGGWGLVHPNALKPAPEIDPLEKHKLKR